MTRPVTDAMVDRAFRTWCSCQAKDMSIEATLRACLASAVAPILREVLMESPEFTTRLNDRFFGLSDDTRQWLVDQDAVAPVAVSVKGLIERLRDVAGPVRLNNGCFADLAFEAAEALSSIIPATKGGEDPFEICAKVAEGHADLVEEMRGIYPGDPQGALGRDANKMRKLAKAIRALRLSALSAQDTDGVAK